MLTIAVLAVALGVGDLLALRAGVTAVRFGFVGWEPCIFFDLDPWPLNLAGSAGVFLSHSYGILLVSNLTLLALKITPPVLAFQNLVAPCETCQNHEPLWPQMRADHPSIKLVQSIQPNRSFRSRPPFPLQRGPHRLRCFAARASASAGWC